VTRRAVRRLHGEDGASLVMAMAFLILFALTLTSLLAFSVTSFRAAGDVEDRIKATYAAGAAVDTAVARIRQDSTMQVGQKSGYTGAKACDITYQTTGTRPTAHATCTPQTSTNAVRPGIDGPDNAILTRNGDLTISTVNGVTGKLHTTGNIFANGNITMDAGNTVDLHDYIATATGNCTPTPALPDWDVVKAYCNATAGTAPQFGDGADPAYAAQPMSPNFPVDLPPTCQGANIAVYVPGYYTSVTNLTTPPAACSSARVFYFLPGTYIFDLQPTLIWPITGIVVGGTPSSNWNFAGSAIPPVPGIGGTQPAACDLSQPGVQFIFARDTQIQLAAPSGVTNSSLELCPPNASGNLAQRVAMYGPASTIPLPPLTSCHFDTGNLANTSCVLRPSSWKSGGLGYATNTVGAIGSATDPTVSPINCPSTSPPPSCYATATAQGTAVIDFIGFDYSRRMRVPPGLVLNGIDVKVSHREPGNVNPPETVNVHLQSSSGTTNPSASCDVPIPLNQTQTFVTDTQPCTGSYTNPLAFTKTTPGGQDFSADLDVTYTVKRQQSNQVVSSDLDGLEIVLHLSPNGNPQTCTAQSGCYFFTNAAGSNSRAGIWGTVYAPPGSINMDFGGTRGIVFDLGVILKSLTVSGLPPSDSTGRFRLRDGTGRTVVLSSTVSGQRVRALVRVVDSATASPHGFLAVVREWSTAK